MPALLTPETPAVISKESFPDIIREYQVRVYHVIRKIVINHDDTDDLVQEVFIRVWQKRESFEGNSSLFTWIYRIAVNEALQFLRRKRNISLTIIGEEGIPEATLRAEMSPDATEIQLHLQKAISLLPDKQRAVFTLKYYDELTYDQMAEILGGSTGGLKASYHHAVKKIENYLQGALNH